MHRWTGWRQIENCSVILDNLMSRVTRKMVCLSTSSGIPKTQNDKSRIGSFVKKYSVAKREFHESPYFSSHMLWSLDSGLLTRVIWGIERRTSFLRPAKTTLFNSLIFFCRGNIVSCEGFAIGNARNCCQCSYCADRPYADTFLHLLASCPNAMVPLCWA